MDTQERFPSLHVVDIELEIDAAIERLAWTFGDAERGEAISQIKLLHGRLVSALQQNQRARRYND